jgi:hypothetical protein
MEMMACAKNAIIRKPDRFVACKKHKYDLTLGRKK